MEHFQLMALSGSLTGDPSVGIAASRAGALGVLDLTFAPNIEAALSSIARFGRYGRGAGGIMIDASAGQLIAAIARQFSSFLNTAIIVPTEPDHLGEQVETLRRSGLRVLLEVVSSDEAELGETVGVDGLIAKGHEAGGRVGESTSFVLLQQLLDRASLPTWVRGGIGLHSAAAAYVAGAAGVALDSQLLLSRESILPPEMRDAIARMDGSETACLGAELGAAYRVYAQPGFAAVDRLKDAAGALMRDTRPSVAVRRAWQDTVRQEVDWADPGRSVWPLGQDAAFAARLARSGRTVGGILHEVRAAVDDHVAAARALRPMAEGAPLAQSHGTRYPIVQGPMTRVSDRAAFAARVAEAGALPFLALALMRGGEVARLLKETKRRLGGRPWGVGILGFVPDELRQEQIAVIREVRPSVRADRRRASRSGGGLEEAASPLTCTFRRLDCSDASSERAPGGSCSRAGSAAGTSVPGRASALWNTMIDDLLEAAVRPRIAAKVHVLFAGGIHDARSAAMLAALAAPLAKAGAKVGVLLGTAYLFTRGGGRNQGDHPRLPARGAPVPPDRAAGDRPRPHHPLRRYAVRPATSRERDNGWSRRRVRRRQSAMRSSS